ncbi:MAG: hybrid sensor histidine kinase/response regulator [Rickettsiaceae bacterium]|jgi:chemotaxis protein histidine kinase CheA|nr:hybrid sensor histidine kinase/response regulator [Rickettsiaceae bacterium]
MDALIEDFLFETKEGLESLIHDMIALESDPYDKELAKRILRIIHAISGTSRFIGFKRIESLAANSEDIFEHVREGKIIATPQITSAVFKALDTINTLVEYIEKHEYEPEGEDIDLINRLQKCLEEHQGKPGISLQDIINEPPPLSELEASATDILPPQDNISNTANKAPEAFVSSDIANKIAEQVKELIQTYNQFTYFTANSKNVDLEVPLKRLNKITTELKEELIQSTLQDKIINILQVEVKGQIFAIPQSSVLEVAKVTNIEYIEDKPILRLREKLIPLISLSSSLGLGKESGDGNFVVVCETASHQFGIVVDKVIETAEIVVHELPKVLQNIGMYTSSTILGNGNILLILDINMLASKTESIADTSSKNDVSEYTSFIIFKSGDATLKAAPLELISRLDEIDISQIDTSSGPPISSYQNNVMHLVKLDPNYQAPQKGVQQLLILSKGERVMGLMVEEIVDIVRCQILHEITSDNNGTMGQMEINGNNCQIVDINYYFEKTFSNIAEEQQVNDITSSDNKVLLVDDSPFFRKFIPPELKLAGYEVTTCCSAKDALSLMENEKFAAVITDINMPDINGIEFANLCSNKPKFKHTPFIAIYSHLDEAIDTNSPEIKNTFEACVSKTDHDQLSKVLGIAITGRKAAWVI